jgi:hypothetical protein
MLAALEEAAVWCEQDRHRDSEDGHPTQDMLEERVLTLRDTIFKALHGN